MTTDNYYAGRQATYAALGIKTAGLPNPFRGLDNTMRVNSAMKALGMSHLAPETIGAGSQLVMPIAGAARGAVGGAALGALSAGEGHRMDGALAGGAVGAGVGGVGGALAARSGSPHLAKATKALEQVSGRHTKDIQLESLEHVAKGLHNMQRGATLTDAAIIPSGLAAGHLAGE